MASATATTSRAASGAPSDEFGTGLTQWNLQAWWDYVTVKLMMSKVSDVIPKTYMPILRLVAEDVQQVDEAYAQVVSLREKVHLLDSPREKWRKMYGSYVRELEWVYGELRNHFPTKEYQELAVDIMARNIRDAMSAFLPNLERMTRSGDAAKTRAQIEGHSERKRGGFEKLFAVAGKWLFSHLNPMGFMVGPVEMKTQSGGQIEMYIPRCWMHTAPGDGRTQDQACVQGCKGACERVFNGNTPIHMEFEPHLPDYSCTLRVQLARDLAPATGT